MLRTHGGATLVEPLLYEPFRHDTSFQARELKSADAKRRIGVAAAELIGEQETIGLTAGTTDDAGGAVDPAPARDLGDYECDQHRDGAVQSAGD